jgi:hypothetical protein
LLAEKSMLQQWKPWPTTTRVHDGRASSAAPEQQATPWNVESWFELQARWWAHWLDAQRSWWAWVAADMPTAPKIGVVEPLNVTGSAPSSRQSVRASTRGARRPPKSSTRHAAHEEGRAKRHHKRGA